MKLKCVLPITINNHNNISFDEWFVLTIITKYGLGSSSSNFNSEHGTIQLLLYIFVFIVINNLR